MFYIQTPFFYPFQGQIFYVPTLEAKQLCFQQNFQMKEVEQQKIVEQKKETNIDYSTQSIENKNLTKSSKETEVKQVKQIIDSDYEPEKNEILIFYKKKNTESNLSNQIYSFISCNKSISIMLKLMDRDNQKVQEFYKLIKRIKKANKKYMNRSYISEFVKMSEGSTNYKIYKRSKCSLNLEKVRKILRISINYFLNNVCDCGLLTSKKMNKETLLEHFKRKRQIIQYLRKEIILSN